MSRFRALDPSGDWQFGAGVQSYLDNEDAIAADIKTALRVFLGECFFAVDFGVDWWNLLAARNGAEENIILQCRQLIASREGVTRINRVGATLDRVTRHLSVTFDVDDLFSRNLSGQVSVP